MAAGKELQYLVDQTRRRHVFEKLRHARNRPFRCGLNLEPELRGNAHGPKHANRVLAVAFRGLADHSEAAFGNILKAMVIVVDLFRCRIVIHGIDGEVAAGRVLPHFAEDVVGNHAAAAVLSHARTLERPEGRALDDFLSEDHVHEAESPSDDDGSALAALYFLWRRVGRHVKVLRRHAEEQIAHCAAHNVRAVPAALQRFAAALRLPGNKLRINAVLGFRDDARLAHQRFPGFFRA